MNDLAIKQENVISSIKDLFFSGTKTRDDILDIERFIKNMPTSFDKCPYPLFHHLENGIYTREIHMRAGDLVCSRIHKDDYFVTMLSGKNWLMNQYETLELTSPSAFTLKGGAKNILYIIEDTVWIDTHKVDAETIEEAEKEIFLDSFEALDEYNNIVQSEFKKEEIDNIVIDQPSIDKVKIKDSKVYVSEDIKKNEVFALTQLYDCQTPIGENLKESNKPNVIEVYHGKIGMLQALEDMGKGTEISVNRGLLCRAG